MNENTPNLTKRQQRLLDHLRQCEARGVSLKDYAESEGLKVADLYSGKQELRRKGVIAGATSRSRFVRARIAVGDDGVETVLCRVRLPNGCVVELRCAPEGQALQSILEAVGRVR